MKINSRQYLIPFIAIHEHKRLITQCENSLQPLKMQICVPRYVCCVKVWSSFFLLGGGDGLNAYILFCLKLFRIFTVVTWLLNGICHINNNRLAKAKALAPPARGPHFKIFVLIHSKQAQLKLKTYNLLFNHFGVGFECRISKEMEDLFFFSKMC